LTHRRDTLEEIFLKAVGHLRPAAPPPPPPAPAAPTEVVHGGL
jgi:hypothetical protein